MIQLHQSQVCITLHRICKFFHEKFLKLLGRLWCLKLFVNFERKKFFNCFFIVASLIRNQSIGCNEVQWRVYLMLIDGVNLSLFDRFKISSQNHLMETIIVHMLQDCPLFSRVNITPLGFFIYFRS